MATFKDNQNRDWLVTIDVVTIKRVRSRVRDAGDRPVDLLQVAEGASGEASLIHRLIADPVLLVDVLYVVCAPECDRRGISDEQFGESLVGDVLGSATDALLEAITDFFPRGKRAALAAALARVREVEQKGSQRAVTLIGSERMTQLIDQELDRLEASLLPTPGDSSTAAPASSS